MRALTEIRRAQVRIRNARLKLRSLNDTESMAKLEVLEELLERIALRLETMLVLGISSSELLRSLLVTSKALEPMKQYAPPDTLHLMSSLQVAIEQLYQTVTPSNATLESLIAEDEVKAVLREAMERARLRVESEFPEKSV